ncbi:ATP-NAD kinase-like domain-containing protein [Podospora conica]|nr:ATP-NAD kinase-like domain-containing protein [Schizothecium conicum]
MTSQDQTTVTASDLGLRQSTAPAETSRSTPDALDIAPGVRLVLEKDSLSLPGQAVDKPQRTCGLGSPSSDGTPASVPYYNILWAETSDNGRTLHVDYAEEVRSHSLGVRSVKFAISTPEQSAASDISQWVERLLNLSYGGAARRKRAWVLINPHAGPGGADKIWQKEVKPIFQAARMPLTVVRTAYSGEAVTLAQEVNIDDFDIAVPCSGDGLPHEVFNGLGKRPDASRALSKIAVCHIPCGSGNAMSCNLYGTHRPSLAALAIVKGLPTPLDLVSVTQDGSRTLSFLSQALGIVADADLSTEHLRWMGAARFTYGFLKLAIIGKTYPCDIAVKVEIEHKDGIKEHYRQRQKIAGSADALDGKDDNSRQSQASSTAPSSQEDGDNTGGGQGLPPLQYGTVTDKLPDGWELVPHTKLGNFYCGNMAYMAPDANFFSAALANDGLMDLVTIDGDVSVFKALSLMMSVESGHFFDSPLVTYRKVSAYRIIPRAGYPDGYISIDGEAAPWGAFQAEIHKGLGLTLSKKGEFDTPGPLNWDKVSTTERLHA